ncbi:MAG: hypothetical protein VXB01_03515 [Opitutae bacterium]
MIFYAHDEIVGKHTQTSQSGKYSVQVRYVSSYIGFTNNPDTKSVHDCEKVHSTLTIAAIVRSTRQLYVASKRTSPSHVNSDELEYNIFGTNKETDREYFKQGVTPHEANLAVLNFANKWLKK